MNVRKFVATTAREALHKVKDLLGPDAIILSNRAVPGGVEIMAVAASEMEKVVPPMAQPAPRDVPKAPDDYSVRLSPAASAGVPNGPAAARAGLSSSRPTVK